jgi:hypothetical protein
VIDDKVRSAWERCTETWSDATAHDAFFKEVIADSCFAWACARYKEKGDDPIAKAQLERLRKAAVAAMVVQRTAPEANQKTPYRSSMIVLICMLVAMLIALFVTKFIHDNRGPEPTKPTRR